MDNNITNDSNNDQAQLSNTSPRYRQIYEYLLREINTGKLNPGDIVPSEKNLCDTFEVSRITSKKALEMLVENKLISRHKGKGSFVLGASNANTSEKFTSSFHSIAFLLSSFNDSFGRRLMYSVEAACEALGYHLILKLTHESAAEEERALRALYDKSIAGILILPAHGELYNAEILRQVLNKRPLVFIDRRMRGLPVPSVATDCVGASKMAVKWLLDQGHRNIAFYSWPVINTSTLEDRRKGFAEAFIEGGITLNTAHICEIQSPQDGSDIILRHLFDHPEITAAFAAEFNIALLVKQVVGARRRQISSSFDIVTFDHPGYPDVFSDFSCLIQDEEALGKQAVEVLHRIIRGEASGSIDNIQIPAELIHGKNVTPITIC